MEFSHEGLRYPVFRAGTGPGVVIMHEIPGITPQVASFARRVANEGFSVALPEMFGTTGKDLSGAYAGREILRACIRREFHVLAARGSSPITIWLRALCRDLHAEVGGVGVGALGMCLTGNFALALMVDPSVMAPVLSQPSLPFPVGSARRSALHISDGDLGEGAATRSFAGPEASRTTLYPRPDVAPRSAFRGCDQNWGRVSKASRLIRLPVIHMGFRRRLIAC